MAATFSSVVNVTPATGTTIGPSPSITTPATNPGVLVSIALNSVTTTVNSLTITGFGGTASEVKTASVTGLFNQFTSVWKIVAPTANTSGTVQANLSASVPYQMAVTAWSDVDQAALSNTADAVTSISGGHNITLTPSNLTSSDATAGAQGNAESQSPLDVVPNARFKNTTTLINLAVGDATGVTGVTFDTNNALQTAMVAVRIIGASGVLPVPGDDDGDSFQICYAP